MPNTIDVEADDFLEAKKLNRELLRRRRLRPVLRDFDVVVIDTPPAMRSATLNGLAVADVVIIPVDGSTSRCWVSTSFYSRADESFGTVF